MSNNPAELQEDKEKDSQLENASAEKVVASTPKPAETSASEVEVDNAEANAAPSHTEVPATEVPATEPAVTSDAAAEVASSNVTAPDAATNEAATNDAATNETGAAETTDEPVATPTPSSSSSPASESPIAATPTEAASDTESSSNEASSDANVAAADLTTGSVESESDQPESDKPRIKIGSQRAEASGTVVPRAVKSAKESSSPISPDQPTPAESPVGPSVDDLSAEWEKEAESVLGGANVNEMMDAASADADLDLPVNTRIKGTVTKVHGDGVFFLLKGQYDGVLPLKQFKKEPEPGTMTDVVVSGFNNEESLYELALPGAAVAVGDWSDLNVGNLVEVRITGSNTGGLECSVNNIRGFIPASQIDVSRVDNLGAFVNQTMECVITEANKKKRNLVLSRRVILEKELKERKKEILEQFEVGSTVEGKITKLRDFGAFVNIGSGVEGLIHISKCSWHHIKHPSEVFEEGQDVSVRLEKINKETGKIQLSHRDTVEHPWKRVSEKYPLDSTVKGTVSKIADFGAFIKLETGVEGLVHISEIAHERVKSVGAVLSEGQEIEVKVLSVDPEKQKMSLSKKALLPVPERAEASEKKREDRVPPREMAVKKRNKPLKGGTGGGAGGENFGLKW